jgi:hypothetical protein
MTRVIESGIDLTEFEEDYHYNSAFDVIFVAVGSRLYTWLALTR